MFVLNVDEIVFESCCPTSIKDDVEETQKQAETEKALAAIRPHPGGLPVRTEVVDAATFWDAEDYHMQYLQKGGQDARKQATETIRCYG